MYIQGFLGSDTEPSVVIGHICLPNKLAEDHTEESSAHKNKRDEIARAIAVADKRMERAYLDRLDGLMDTVLCGKIIEDTKKEKAALLQAQEGLNEVQTAYYEAGYAIHELASQAQAIYESPKATTEEKRLLLSYIFLDIKLEEGMTRPNYTYAFEFLSEWIPKVNKNFEPAQKSVKSDILRRSFIVPPLEFSSKLLATKKEFRTVENPYANLPFGNSDAKLNTLLREQDSNLRPIA